MKWYTKVTRDPDDLTPLVDCIGFFENELITARREVNISGSLEKASASLPGIVEVRFAQLQEVEAILEYLNILLKKAKGKAFKKYLEGYARALTSRDAEKYADTDDDVIKMALLVNEFALVRNNYLSVMKALDTKGFQINNITKLRTSGMEDAEIKAIYVPKVYDSHTANKHEDDE